MSIKDYLHLYLGCEVQTPDCVGKYLGDYFSTEIDEFNGANIFYPDQLRVYVQNYNQVKPLLRPLSTMTEEDVKEAESLALNLSTDEEEQGILGSAQMTAYLLSKRFDLFGLIEAGLAIDKTKMNGK